MQKFSVQVKRSHYFTSEYNHKARWLSYFYQIRLIQELKAKNVLEIGPGNGWVAMILRDLKFNVTTVDIDPALKPDIVADICKLPFEDNSFDVALAAEVLEHLPFETFFDNLKELKRVSKKHIVISLPDHRRTLTQFSLKVPFLKHINFLIKIPSFKKHIFDGQHYWEIGKKDYSLKRIKDEITKAGLKIEKNFVPHDAPMNHYFVLRI